MSKSYVAKTKISFVEDAFYVNTGDILVHDSANNNSLVVYRGGQIVKVMHHSPLKVLSMLKSKFIEEVLQPKAAAPAPKREKLPDIKFESIAHKQRKTKLGVVSSVTDREEIQATVAKRKEEVKDPAPPSDTTI